MWQKLDNEDYGSIISASFPKAVLICGEELPGRGKVVLESFKHGNKIEKTGYAVSFSVYTLLVHTLCCSDGEKAVSLYGTVKDEIGAFFESPAGQNFSMAEKKSAEQVEWCKSFLDKLNGAALPAHRFEGSLGKSELASILAFGKYEEIEESQRLRAEPANFCRKGGASSGGGSVVYTRDDGSEAVTKFSSFESQAGFFLYCARRIFNFYHGKVVYNGGEEAHCLDNGDIVELKDGSVARIKIALSHGAKYFCEDAGLGMEPSFGHKMRYIMFNEISRLLIRAKTDEIFSDGEFNIFYNIPFKISRKFSVHIAGTQYYDAPDYAPKLRYGDDCELRFEPDNKHDKNAIEVYSKDGAKLGYIPKSVNKQIGPFLKMGLLIVRIESYEISASATGVFVNITLLIVLKNGEEDVWEKAQYDF
jgi:hypothetical protein